MKTNNYNPALFTILLIISFCSCVRDDIILPGNLSGYVTDADANEPIKDATIRLNPSSDSTTTGDEGEYLFENIPSKKYEIEASKPTYETVSKDIEVKEAQVTEVNFGLSKTPSPQISPAFLDFSIDEVNLSFTISNAGSGIINYSISSSQNWITLSHFSGEVAAETDTIIVSIDRSGLSDEIIKEKVYITFSVDGIDEIHESMDIFINGIADQDGNYYRVVEIGTQIWMAENMNVGSMVKLNINWPQDNGIIEKFCYDNLESNCEIYGGLYTWNEMSHYTPPSTEMSDNFQGICPDGWPYTYGRGYHNTRTDSWWNGGCRRKA